MLLFSVLGLGIPAIFTHALPESSLTTEYEGFSVVAALLDAAGVCDVVCVHIRDSPGAL